MTRNPPPLVSPVPGLDVAAVLDQDELLTAGLAVSASGERAVLLVGANAVSAGGRRDLTAWGRALADVGRTAPTARLADFGHTVDGRPFLATYVEPSLADRMRRIGPPGHGSIRAIATAVAEVLAAAHAAGIAHAAVSPAAILVDDNQVRLGGFGASAPGLEAPLGVWAFTAPEHRHAAAAGGIVGTPAADVFGLAATVCVARAGMLPWSDAVSWADAAGVPTGRHVAGWAEAIRAALHANPDQRPTAREFAAAMRNGDDPPDEPATAMRVDLRGLIPRKVRRLAAYSVDAMVDGSMPVVARAARLPAAASHWQADVEPTTVLPRVGADGRIAAGNRPDRTPDRAHDQASDESAASATESDRDEGGPDGPTGFGQAVLTRPAAAAIAATATALLLGSGAYAWAQQGRPPAPPAAPAVVAAPTTIPRLSQAQLLAGARQAGQQFIHNVGVRSELACAGVIGGKVVRTAPEGAPISCARLIGHARSLLGSDTLDAMATANVTAAVGYSGGSVAGPAAGPDPRAFISLANVPGLRKALTTFEMLLTFRDQQWKIVEVTLS